MTDYDRMKHAMQSPCIPCNEFVRRNGHHKGVDPHSCSNFGTCGNIIKAAEYLQGRGGWTNTINQQLLESLEV